jgi:hypothetical protein
MKHDDLFNQRTKIINDLKASHAKKIMASGTKVTDTFKKHPKPKKKKKHPAYSETAGFDRPAYASFWG